MIAPPLTLHWQGRYRDGADAYRADSQRICARTGSRTALTCPGRVRFVYQETEWTERAGQCVVGRTVFSFSFTSATRAAGEIGLTT